MNISRNHAQIVYNFERGALRAHCSCVLRLPTVVQAVFGDTGSWEMVVMGKNGVTVQGTLYAPVDGQPMSGIQLHSQDYIQIGDRGFYFLLPRCQARHAQSVGAPASGWLATGVSRSTELGFGVCRPGVASGGWPASGSKQPRCVPFHTDTLVVCYGDHPYRWCNIHGACQTWRARGQEKRHGRACFGSAVHPACGGARASPCERGRHAGVPGGTQRTGRRCQGHCRGCSERARRCKWSVRPGRQRRCG